MIYLIKQLYKMGKVKELNIKKIEHIIILMILLT